MLAVTKDAHAIPMSPITPVDASPTTSDTAIVVKPEPAHHPVVTIGRGHHILGGVVILSAGALTTANHITHQNSLQPKSTAHDPIVYLYTVSLVNWIVHNYKALWRDVSSYNQQAATIVALPVIGLGVDVIAGLATGDYQFSTTVLMALAATPFSVKSIGKSLLGALPYRGGNQEIVPLSPKQLANRRLVLYGFHGALCAGMAVADQTMSDAVKPVVFAIFSGAVAKEGKCLIAVLEGRGNKIFSLFKLAVTAEAFAALMGAAFPLQRHSSFYNRLYHYTGAPTAIILSAIGTNLLIRAIKEPKVKAVHGEKPVASTKKGVVYAAAFAGVTVAASAFNAVTTSKVLLLGSRLCQAGWGFHLLRETLKSAKTTAAKATIIVTTAVEVVGIQFAANAVEKAIRDEEVTRWDAMAAGIGTTVAFAAKLVRNKYAPKD